MNEQESRLRDEILADAREQAAKIAADAAAEAKRIVAEAAAGVEAAREQALAEATAAAAAKAKMLSAGVEMEIGRRWLMRQEDGIGRVLADALAEAEGVSGEARASSLAALAREAMAAIGDDTYVARVCAADASVVTASWLDEQASAVFGAGRRGGASRVEIAAGLGGGLVVVTADGRKTFDNTYATRLARMRDGLRLLVVND